MQPIQKGGFQLIGLSLKHQTTNINGQSAIDCGNLWQEFEKTNCAALIPAKLSANIFAVYHNYEGDHTQPYSYFIGCEVQPGTEVPNELTELMIPAGLYKQITVKGNMPDCVAKGWEEIWKSNINRAYRPDFEVYDERSRDWQNAEVGIYLSVNP
jgi:predicted transcriptional regulator YdeE